MPDKHSEYVKRLSVQVTQAMDDRLQQVARGRDEAKSEVIRAALRAFLDEQEDVMGSRKHFTKAFGRRIDHVEQLVSIAAWLSFETLHRLTERLQKQSLEPADLLAEAVREGMDFREILAELIELVLRRKTKPPA